MTERREAIRDAREQRRDDWHDPTKADLMAGLFAIQNDVDYYNWLDGCKQAGYGGIEQEFLALQEQMGITLDRVHNCSDDSPLRGTYDIPPGIPCTFGLSWSGLLFQWQVAEINACTPLETVIAAGDMVKATLEHFRQRLQARRSPLSE